MHKFSARAAFLRDLTQCLFDFVIQLLPTPEEIAIKEDVRRLLEKLIRTIEPDSHLLAFGSTANGFSLRNSDMDLCCLIESKGPRLQASDLVSMLGDLLERETKFHVKTLPFARIPIVKLSLDPSPGLPYGISCDIGFENRLALENTRLLLSYASIDPTRVRTMVLFLKVWTKRRKINSPYRGTLSSYGYVLLVIYFLVHVKNPPVLPNLQSIPPLRPISHEDMHLGEHNIWFFDDIELLRQKWQSSNVETVAELLVDFFKFYSREFPYNTDVVSIRAGFMTKDTKGWQSENEGSRYVDPSRERNRLCIEDPFETTYNVARTVTRDGLYTIRGEFMRASRILAAKPDRALVALAQLCEEREDELVPATPINGNIYLVNPAARLPPLPPQVPYTVASSQAPPPVPIQIIAPSDAPNTSTDDNVISGEAGADESSEGPRPLLQPLATSSTTTDELPVPGPSSTISPVVTPAAESVPHHMHNRKTSVDVVAEGGTPKLQHMAPTRAKWTSPPPPDAPSAAHDSYRNRLGLGLTLATSSTPAREAAPEEKRSPSTISTTSSIREGEDEGTDDERRKRSREGSPDTEADTDVGNTSFESSASASTVVASGSQTGLRHPIPMRLQLGKQSVPDLTSNSPSDHERESASPRTTPRIFDYGATGGRGRVSERSGDASSGPGPTSASTSVSSTSASTSTPTNNRTGMTFSPHVKHMMPSSLPRRSSSGPPTLRSPSPASTSTPPPDATGMAGPFPGGSKPSSNAPSPRELKARNLPLTLDTAYYNPPVPISPSASPKKNSSPLISSPLIHSTSSHYPQTAHPGHLPPHPHHHPPPFAVYHPQSRSAWGDYPPQYYPIPVSPVVPTHAHMMSQTHSHPHAMSHNPPPQQHNLSQQHTHSHPHHSRAPSGSSSGSYHHRHSASGSSSHHYPVTLYRTQAPQATTFPLYQQTPVAVPAPELAQEPTDPAFVVEAAATGSGSGKRSPVDSVDEGAPSSVSMNQSQQDSAQSSNHTSTALPTSSMSASTLPENPNSQSSSAVDTNRKSSFTAASTQKENGDAPKATSSKLASSRSSLSSEKKGTPPGTQSVSRNGSVARKKYDPSAAFRIPTTTQSSPTSPTHVPLPPTPPESVTGKSPSPAGSVVNGGASSPSLNGAHTQPQYRAYQPYHHQHPHHYRRGSASSPGGSGHGSSSPVPSPTTMSPATTGMPSTPQMHAHAGYVRGVPMMASVGVSANGVPILIPLGMPMPIHMPPHGTSMAPSASSPMSMSMRGSPVMSSPHIVMPGSRGGSPGPSANLEREKSSSSLGNGNGYAHGVTVSSRRGMNTSNTPSLSSSSLKGASAGASTVEFEAPASSRPSSHGSANGNAEAAYVGTW